MEHTKGKVKALQQDLGHGHKGNIVITTQENIDENIPWIADCGYSENSAANAKRFVKCWNSHDALLDACKQAVCGNMGWKGMLEHAITHAEEE